MWGDSLLVERLACFAGLLSTCLITGDIHFSSFFINLFIHLPYKWNKMTSFFHPFFYPLFIHFLQVKQNFVKFSSIFLSTFHPLHLFKCQKQSLQFFKKWELAVTYGPAHFKGPNLSNYYPTLSYANLAKYVCKQKLLFFLTFLTTTLRFDIAK